MSEHTPTPWHRSLILGRHHIIDPAGIVIATQSEDNYRCCGLDDMAFIVRAVNSHSALLAALKAVEWVRHGCEYETNSWCPQCERTEHNGHAPDCLLAKAIAQAEGVNDG